MRVAARTSFQTQGSRGGEHRSTNMRKTLWLGIAALAPMFASSSLLADGGNKGSGGKGNAQRQEPVQKNAAPKNTPARKDDVRREDKREDRQADRRQDDRRPEVN